jgi:small subunit ribosomal protein S20
MANSKSAEKRIRQNEKRRKLNRTYISGSRTAIRKARALIASGDENATEAVIVAMKALDRAAGKGVIHPKNAARRKSRLAKALNEMSA